MTTAETRVDSSWAQGVYYAGWVAMFLAESVLWAAFGIVLGVIAFVVGGVAWGSWQAAHTSPAEPLRGPILRWTQRLLDLGRRPAFVGAVVLGGPSGVGAAAAASADEDVTARVVTASIVYAALCLTFHLLRPQGALPMHLGPRLP